MEENQLRRGWVLDLLEEAFKKSLTERDYQIVRGIQKYYPLSFSGNTDNKPDLMLINLAYQIGKAENNRRK